MSTPTLQDLFGDQTAADVLRAANHAAGRLAMLCQMGPLTLKAAPPHEIDAAMAILATARASLAACVEGLEQIERIKRGEA